MNRRCRSSGCGGCFRWFGLLSKSTLCGHLKVADMALPRSIRVRPCCLPILSAPYHVATEIDRSRCIQRLRDGAEILGFHYRTLSVVPGDYPSDW